MNEDWRNELITKGAAFKKVEDKMKSLLKYFGYDSYEQADEKTQLAYDGMMDALTAIYDTPPSTQLERMSGEWEEHKDYPNLAYLCSKCGYFTTLRTHYCPSCGSDMRGEENARI